MGVYDSLPGGQQVKCWWCDMRLVKIGDAVPELDCERSYSIALREGGYANVLDCTLVSIADTQECDFDPVFDKYGDPFDPTWEGSLGESYLFEEEG